MDRQRTALKDLQWRTTKEVDDHHAFKRSLKEALCLAKDIKLSVGWEATQHFISGIYSHYVFLIFCLYYILHLLFSILKKKTGAQTGGTKSKGPTGADSNRRGTNSKLKWAA